MKSQWEKFKHRTLTKVFVGYAVVAWVLIQVIETVLPTFETPVWVAQTIIFLLILGFPIAILVGWASEKLPAASDVSGAPSEVSQLAHATPKRTLVWVGVGSCIVVGLFGFYMMPFVFDDSAFKRAGNNNLPDYNSAARYSSVKYEIDIGETGTRGWGSRSDIALSPSGRHLAYSDYNRPNITLLLKDLNSFEEPVVLDSITIGPQTGYPTFSEDGQWVLYHDEGAIKRVRTEGGAPEIVVSEFASPNGVAARGQQIVFNDLIEKQLKVYDVSSGITEPIVPGNFAEGDLDYTWPQFIPNENKLIATKGTRGTFSSARIDLIDLDSGEIKTIAPVGYKGRYAQSGHIVFIRGDNLWAQPISPDTFDHNGDAVPVIFDVEIYEPFGNVGFDLSQDGRLIYLPGDLSDIERINQPPVLVDRLGIEESLALDPQFYLWPNLSPSGNQMAISTFDGSSAGSSGFDVWLYDFELGTLGRRSFEGNASSTIWSLAGDRLIYQCEQTNICSIAANGTDSESILSSGLTNPLPLSQVSDTELLISQGNPTEIYVMNLTGQNESVLENLNLSSSQSYGASLSSDMKWIAYISDETGRREIYVRPYPDVSKGKWQVSRQGGVWPLWNDSMNELIWWSEEAGEILKVDFEVEEEESASSIRFSNPIVMFSTNHRGSPSFFPYDYDSNKEKFVFISQTSTIGTILEQQTKLKVIENWFGELSFLAPARNN